MRYAVLLSGSALAVFVVTLIFTVLVSIQPFFNVADKYFCIGFGKLYTDYEYRDVVYSLSYWLGGYIPISMGLTPPQVFGLVVQMMVEKYPVFDRVLSWIVINDLSTSYYMFTLPIAFLLASVSNFALVDSMSVKKYLQLISIVGVRRYYIALAIGIVLTSFIYSFIASLPVLMYGCTWCDTANKAVGYLSIFMLFVIMLLLGNIAYVLLDWNSVAILVIGIITVIIWLININTMMFFIEASKNIFGIGAPTIGIFLVEIPIALTEFLLLYLFIDRREKY